MCPKVAKNVAEFNKCLAECNKSQLNIAKDLAKIRKMWLKVAKGQFIVATVQINMRKSVKSM